MKGRWGCAFLGVAKGERTTSPVEEAASFGRRREGDVAVWLSVDVRFLGVLLVAEVEWRSCGRRSSRDSTMARGCVCGGCLGGVGRSTSPE